MATDLDTVESDTQSAQIDPPEADLAADAAASDLLSDPLEEGGDGDDAVQMILPPKPGAGPRVGDPVSSIEEILAERDAD